MRERTHLLVCLHDAGTDPRQFAEAASLWGSFVDGLEIVCPEAPGPFDMGERGRQWYSLDGISERDWSDRVEAGAAAAAERIAAARAAAGVPPERTLVAGFSQGAAVLLRLADRSGRSGFHHMLLFSAQPEPGPWAPASPDGWPAVHLFHGETDDVVPLELAYDLLKRLHGAGVDASLFVDNLSPHIMGKAVLLEAGSRIARIVGPTH